MGLQDNVEVNKYPQTDSDKHPTVLASTILFYTHHEPFPQSAGKLQERLLKILRLRRIDK